LEVVYSVAWAIVLEIITKKGKIFPKTPFSFKRQNARGRFPSLPQIKIFGRKKDVNTMYFPVVDRLSDNTYL
jgi:hypothetical protein